KRCAYDVLPATKKDPDSLNNGPSTANLLEINPMPPVRLRFLLFPSFWRTSNTDDTRPPNLAGISPLYNLISLMASLLKTEKKPKKCEVLYIMASSNSTKF